MWWRRASVPAGFVPARNAGSCAQEPVPRCPFESLGRHGIRAHERRHERQHDAEIRHLPFVDPRPPGRCRGTELDIGGNTKKFTSPSVPIVCTLAGQWLVFSTSMPPIRWCVGSLSNGIPACWRTDELRPSAPRHRRGASCHPSSVTRAARARAAPSYTPAARENPRPAANGRRTDPHDVPPCRANWARPDGGAR
jgi:hypothetical protein